MKVMDTIASFFTTLQSKDFKRGTLATIGLILLTSIGLIYRHFVQIRKLKKEIAMINQRRRDEIEPLLTRYELVKKQKAEVETILKKDPAFKIIQFINSVMDKLQLGKFKTKDHELQKHPLENGYTENELYVSLAGVNIQQVVQFLYSLEENERVYTKDIELYKPEPGSTINANIRVATLQPGQTTLTSEE
jgi:hypothetical protein